MALPSTDMDSKEGLYRLSKIQKLDDAMEKAAQHCLAYRDFLEELYLVDTKGCSYLPRGQPAKVSILEVKGTNILESE